MAIAVFPRTNPLAVLSSSMNWGHPLADKLILNYDWSQGGGEVSGGGSAPLFYDKAGHFSQTTMGNSGTAADWNTYRSPYGPALWDNSQSGALHFVLQNTFTVAPPLSIQAYLFAQHAPTTDAIRATCHKSTTNTGDNYVFELDWDHTSGTANKSWQWHTTNGFQRVQYASTISAGLWYDLVFTMDSSLNAKAYLNGKLDVSGTGTGTLDSGAGWFSIYCGTASSGTTQGLQIPHAIVRIWTRVLGAHEVQQLYQDPFCMYVGKIY